MIIDWLVSQIDVLVANGVLFTIFYFLGRSLLNQKFQKQLEDYKRDIGKELEAFKTQFNRLDQMRADCVLELHGIMHEIEHIITGLGTGYPCSAKFNDLAEYVNSIMDSLDEVDQLTEKFIKLVYYHFLLLGSDRRDSLEEWYKEINQHVFNISNDTGEMITILKKKLVDSQKVTPEQILSEGKEEFIKIKAKNGKRSFPKLRKLRQEIDPFFKEMLGIEDDKKTSES